MVTVAAPSRSLTVGGIGDGGLEYGVTKAGPGKLVLSGTNTYSGATTIQDGTLALVTSASNSIASSSGVVVGDTSAAGGTVFDVSTVTYAGGFRLLGTQSLSGFGSVTGSVTVLDGGAISPGVGSSETGALTVNGDLTLRDGVEIACDLIGGTLDHIEVRGKLTLPDQATVTVNYSGIRPSSPRVLFSADEIDQETGDMRLSGWQVLPTGSVGVVGNTVVLIGNMGTCIMVR